MNNTVSMYLVNNICSIFALMIDYDKWVLFLKSHKLENFKSFVYCLIWDSGSSVVLQVHMEAPLKASRYYGLYFPNSMWHCGQVWVVSFMLSMQKGIRQQGQHPMRQRITVIKNCRLKVWKFQTVKKGTVWTVNFVFGQDPSLWCWVFKGVLRVEVGSWPKTTSVSICLWKFKKVGYSTVNCITV